MNKRIATGFLTAVAVSASLSATAFAAEKAVATTPAKLATAMTVSNENTAEFTPLTDAIPATAVMQLATKITVQDPSADKTVAWAEVFELGKMIPLAKVLL